MFRQQSQSAGFLRNGRLSRRCMLRGSGVALPLPFLNCMTAAAAGSEADAANRRRMVAAQPSWRRFAAPTDRADRSLASPALG